MVEVGELAFAIAGFAVREGGRWSLDDVDGTLVCAKDLPHLKTKTPRRATGFEGEIRGRGEVVSLSATRRYTCHATMTINKRFDHCQFADLTQDKAPAIINHAPPRPN